MTDPPFVASIARARRGALPRAAADRDAGRLPRDRGQARPAAQPDRRQAAADADRPRRARRRSRRRDRRDDEAPPRGERRLVGPDPRDPELGRRGDVVPMPHDNEWAGRHELAKRFVVMHSGNIGHAQNLDALVRSTTFLRDLDDLAVVLIGSGARRAELVALTGSSRRTRSRFFPYQTARCSRSRSRPQPCTSSGWREGLRGTSSRAASTGSSPPAARSSPRPTPTARRRSSSRRSAAGLLSRRATHSLLAAAIRAAHDGEYDLEEMGRRARAFAEAESDRSIAVQRYRAVIDELQEAGAHG